MYALYKKISNFIKKSKIVKQISLNKFIFYSVFELKKKFNKFKVSINTKCLVLSQYPGAEIKGLGGLIAQYPKNFEVLCLTNGSGLKPEMNSIDCAALKKQQFQEVMSDLRVKGYKIFDINSGELKTHYLTFKKIDISEADYIFLPNIYDSNMDTLALLKHFKQMLKEKEFKDNLKILMYESDFALCNYDYFVDISSIIETKKRMLSIYVNDKETANKITGINAFRSIQHNCEYIEAFLCFNVDEFLKIPLI